MGSNDEGWEMVWNGGMGWRGIDCVDGGHCRERQRHCVTGVTATTVLTCVLQR